MRILLSFGLAVAGSLLLSQFAAPAREVLNVSIDCSAFKKNGNGTWSIIKETKVVIGNTSTTLAGMTFGIGAFNIGGYDLASILNRTCP